MNTNIHKNLRSLGHETIAQFAQKADRYLRALNVIGIDQGIHNLLIHLRGAYSAINNDEHVFPALGYAPTNSIKIDADRSILVDGKAPAVVCINGTVTSCSVTGSLQPSPRSAGAATRLHGEGRS
jgi:hypothetical protein